MTKEYVFWVRKILDANLMMHNTITAICPYAVPVMRYTFRVVKWNKGKLAKLDTKTCKMLTRRGFHRPHRNTHYLYLSRKKGGQGLTGLIDMHWHKCTTLADYIT
eukprot:15348468-Ditylum_brightwellii.AAC.1